MIRSRLKSIGSLLRDVVNSYLEDKVPRLGASLSFYTILSLPPMLMLLTTVLGLFFKDQIVEGQINEEVVKLVGEKAAAVIKGIVMNNARDQSGVGFTLVGIGAAIFSATGVFVALQDAFNTIWGVQPKEGTGNVIIHFLKTRLVSIAVILSLALLMMAVMLVGAVLLIFNNYILAHLPEAYRLITLLNAGLSFVLFTFAFAALFKFIPDVSLQWKQVWKGAVFTTCLFIVGRWLIGLYLANSNITGAYGVAGSLVVLLLWIFYSSQILFFGAEFTKVLNLKQGHVIKARPYAVKVAVKTKEVADAEETKKPHKSSN